MPKFSQKSLDRLHTCDERLVAVFMKVIEDVDCSVLEGFRDEEAQREMVRQGKSQLVWPHSKHNRRPSLAVDVVPYPIDWLNKERFAMFAGYVLGTAARMGVTLRWGGDWNMDFDPTNQTFYDAPHFEIMNNLSVEK